MTLRGIGWLAATGIACGVLAGIGMVLLPADTHIALGFVAGTACGVVAVATQGEADEDEHDSDAEAYSVGFLDGYEAGSNR